MALRIGQREVRNVTVLDLEGQLVAGDEAASFRELIDVLIGEAKIWILANLHGVRMIDSSGLGVLVSAHLAIEKAAGAMKLLNASQRHMNLLVLTKLSTLFPNFEDEGAAIESFLPKEQTGRQFDILEFVRSEENDDQLLTSDARDQKTDSASTALDGSEKS
ncbi:MAG: STAS domain-containing protein [Bryobacteraceae bacterium]